MRSRRILGLAVATILPRQHAIDALPRGRVPGDLTLAHQRQIGDRKHQCSTVGRNRAVPVAEGVELFHIGEVHAGLLVHPSTETQLEGTVTIRVERSERQGSDPSVDRARGHRQDPGLFLRHRHDRGVQTNGHSAWHHKVSPLLLAAAAAASPERTAASMPEPWKAEPASTIGCDASAAFRLYDGGRVPVVEDRQRVGPATDPRAQGLSLDREDALHTPQRTLRPGVVVELL